jgi:hypothetical protein
MSDEVIIPTMPAPFEAPAASPAPQPHVAQLGAIHVADLEAALRLSFRLQEARSFHEQIANGDPAFVVRIAIYAPVPEGRTLGAAIRILDLVDLGEPVALYVERLLAERLSGLGVNLSDANEPL